MAPKPATKTAPADDTTQADANGTAQSGEAQPTQWDELAVPVAMPNKVAFLGVKADVLKTVPAAIRMRAEMSLTENVKAVDKTAGSNAERPRVNYVWYVQQVKSTDQGNDFIKLITKYAKYRPDKDGIEYAGTDSPKGQVTARCGDVTHYRLREDGITVACQPDQQGAFLAVRYSVRPFERRADTSALPGSQ